MTLTADHPARANRDGDPCPPWCVTDHAKYGFHGAAHTLVYAPQFHSCHIRPIRYGANSLPEVEIAAAGMFSVRPREAVELARVIEQLATATPEQHRELAAAIRQAAAAITEAPSA